jgi:hypothetical protein
MKIKDLIKHLQTLDQDKELVIIGTDPTDWDYGMVVNENSISLENVYPSEDNGLEGELEIPELNEDDDDFEGEVECYVIRIDC